jgi:deoxyribonuclease V
MRAKIIGQNRLWEALNKSFPILGVAKSKFGSARPVEVFRGLSKVPLFVTAVGIAPEVAAQNVCSMQGAFRIPTLAEEG